MEQLSMIILRGIGKTKVYEWDIANNFDLIELLKRKEFREYIWYGWDIREYRIVNKRYCLSIVVPIEAL